MGALTGFHLSCTINFVCRLFGGRSRGFMDHSFFVTGVPVRCEQYLWMISPFQLYLHAVGVLLSKMLADILALV